MVKQWAFVAALLGSSLINVILFFRIIEIGYGFHESHGEHTHSSGGTMGIEEAPFSMLIPTIAVALAIILIGFYNQTILSKIIQFAVPKI